MKCAKKLQGLAMDGTAWDTRPLLLGVGNGVLDLEAGRLRDGAPEDYITKATPVVYDPGATCPRFERFMHEIFADHPDLGSYLQRCLGYALTGLTGEQVFWIFWGLTALSEPIRPVVTFAYLTGWRIRSEILPLEWRQVDFAAGTVRLEVGTTKNDEGREFPFDVYPDLRDVLEQQRALTRQVEQRREQIVPWVFHRNGRPIRSFYRSWHTACEAAGCPSRIPHDFRRTAVRNLVRAGVPERVAMMLTGHKTRSVFDRYNIVSGADLRDGVKKLAAAAMVTKTVTISRSGQVERIRKRRK